MNTPFAHESSSSQYYTVKIKSVREIVREWLDMYNRQLLDTPEMEKLIKELEQFA